MSSLIGKRVEFVISAWRGLKPDNELIREGTVIGPFSPHAIDLFMVETTDLRQRPRHKGKCQTPVKREDILRVLD